MNKTKTYPTTSIADMNPDKRRDFIVSRANATAKAERALQEDLKNIGNKPAEETETFSNERKKVSTGTKLAIGAAATAAMVGGVGLVNEALEGRSEVDDFKHYVDGGTPEDLNPDPSKQVVEVEAPSN